MTSYVFNDLTSAFCEFTPNFYSPVIAVIIQMLDDISSIPLISEAETRERISSTVVESTQSYETNFLTSNVSPGSLRLSKDGLTGLKSLATCSRGKRIYAR
jgi:hypothetical protein